MDPSPQRAPAGAHDVVRAVRKDRLRAVLFDVPPVERRIGRYRVIGMLGRGGMGTVLEAVDDALERRVALKLLHPGVPARDRGRLLREARALARLSHPNVVQVHDVGESPQPFIAMKLVRGRTLAEWQRARPPWRACVRAYLQAGRGLAAAHAQRLVHRDFKPSNCLIDDEGRVRVMDFGLARALDLGAPSDGHRTPRPDARAGDSRLTEEGTVLGTLAYMSLEQLRGKEVDARSDQFGFCVALWEALHGERPFAGSTAAALERALLHEQVRAPPRDSRVPPALRKVLLRGLSADPARRWRTMNELLAALERLVRPRWHRQLTLATVLGGLGIAGAGVGVWHELAMQRACSGVEDELSGVWDPDRRTALGEALFGSPLPHARAPWEGIEPRLAAYAEAWVEAAHDVCEQAQARQQQPESLVALRSACLHERKVALREAVDVLASAEPSAVEHAVGLVSQLPGLERCGDAPALLAEIPPPADPWTRARVQGLRDALIEARTLRIAGRHAEALAAVGRAASEAGSVQYSPLWAELELQRGWVLHGLGRTDEAVAAYQAAYMRAVAEGHDAVAAEAAARLSSIVGEVQSKHELAIQWSMVAQSHARRPAADPGAEARALASIAPVYHQMGDLERAQACYEEVLRLQEQARVPDGVQLASTLDGLASVLLARNDRQRARALGERAQALRRQLLGPHHPSVASSPDDVGVVLRRRDPPR